MIVSMTGSLGVCFASIDFLATTVPLLRHGVSDPVDFLEVSRGMFELVSSRELVPGQSLLNSRFRDLSFASSQEKGGAEANLDLHQFGDGTTGLCFCRD
jgi:hypothetical protein